MFKFLYWLFTTRDQREFSKIVEHIETTLREAETLKQVKSITVLINRLDHIKTCDEDEEIVENLMARRLSAIKYFEE